MSCVIEIMRVLPHFYPAKGATPEMIADAEEQLGLTFSDEYREYVRAFGNASVNGHEITGVTGEERINVVAVTLAERMRNPLIPKGFYVVEQTGIDRIVVWQDSSGFIFQSIPGGKLVKIFDALCEYIAS